jgi:hypothetical protein
VAVKGRGEMAKQRGAAYLLDKRFAQLREEGRVAADAFELVKVIFRKAEVVQLVGKLLSCFGHGGSTPGRKVSRSAFKGAIRSG